ncbi:hypothetical protein GCM10007921_16320 [Tritonibacter mobilis]|nr:hypothetical protein GCM10007921_16320 [Tritonibacter mobilis]
MRLYDRAFSFATSVEITDQCHDALARILVGSSRARALAKQDAYAIHTRIHAAVATKRYRRMRAPMYRYSNREDSPSCRLNLL